MKSANPRSAAIASLLLSLPMLLILLMITLGMDPDLTSQEPVHGLLESRIGSIPVLLAFLFFCVGFGVSLCSALHILRAGDRLATSWMNVGLAATQLIVILGVIGAIVVDQYPCWIGVPNCDQASSIRPFESQR